MGSPPVYFFESGRSSSEPPVPASNSDLLQRRGRALVMAAGPEVTPNATELEDLPSLAVEWPAWPVTAGPVRDRLIPRTDFRSKMFRSRHKSTPPDRILKMIAPFGAFGER